MAHFPARNSFDVVANAIHENISKANRATNEVFTFFLEALMLLLLLLVASFAVLLSKLLVMAEIVVSIFKALMSEETWSIFSSFTSLLS